VNGNVKASANRPPKTTLKITNRLSDMLKSTSISGVLIAFIPRDASPKSGTSRRVIPHGCTGVMWDGGVTHIPLLEHCPHSYAQNGEGQILAAVALQSRCPKTLAAPQSTGAAQLGKHPVEIGHDEIEVRFAPMSRRLGVGPDVRPGVYFPVAGSTALSPSTWRWGLGLSRVFFVRPRRDLV
jgi:hypothetical protein